MVGSGIRKYWWEWQDMHTDTQQGDPVCLTSFFPKYGREAKMLQLIFEYFLSFAKCLFSKHWKRGAQTWLRPLHVYTWLNRDLVNFRRGGWAGVVQACLLGTGNKSWASLLSGAAGGQRVHYSTSWRRLVPRHTDSACLLPTSRVRPQDARQNRPR
jgi:hypothetical protein